MLFEFSQEMQTSEEALENVACFLKVSLSRDLIKEFETPCYFLSLFHSNINQCWLKIFFVKKSSLLVLSCNLVHGMLLLCFTY